MSFVNIHHHSTFSTYDGFSKPKEAAKYAKEMGQNALALTDHGTTAGLIEHYNACLDNGIKPILGVEAYFQPEFDKEKDRFHIIFLAKNEKGYENINKMITEANKHNFYYKPVVDFEMIKKYNEGVICTIACAVGYFSYLVDEGHNDKTIKKTAKLFKNIYGEDFYFEVMPVDFDMQLAANKRLPKIAKSLDVPVIMTNDSHYVKPEDYDSYQMYHKIKENDIEADYSKRHMVDENKVKEMWKELHSNIDPDKFIENTQKLTDKCVNPKEYLKKDKISMVPEFSNNAEEEIKELAVNGLEERGKWNEEYKEQLEFELDVIHHHGFENYFLLTKDIVDFAKENDIKVGFGRGSVGGCLLAYALGITEIDAVKLDTNFERFLRKEKKKFPDIDIDFDSDRRDEVINYILNKYKGRSAPIANFGLWKVRNLINDLDNHYEMEEKDKKAAKKQLEKLEDKCELDEVSLARLRKSSKLRKIDEKYPNFLKHFQKLYKQVRFIGRHAAGIAITPDEITKYVSLQRVRGDLQTAHDLDGLEEIGILKMDILGLSTLSIIGEVEKNTDAEWKDEILADKEVYGQLSQGNTIGVFQFEKPGAQQVLQQVSPQNIQELVACNALNRPAPKKLGILDRYVDAKNGDIKKDTPWYDFTQDAYGNIVYQEHVMEICRTIGEMNWDKTDVIMKNLGSAEDLKNEFVEGATKNGLDKNEAREMFDNMTAYLFNKGHGAAYSLLSLYCMYLKHNYPTEFYHAILMVEGNDYERTMYEAAAAQEDNLILLPHVNGCVNYGISEIEGEKCIQKGLISIKGIGQKTAEKIIEHTPFESEEVFKERVSGRYSSDNVVKKLKEEGALEFRRKRFWSRIIKYNRYLHSKQVKIY
jgi:DNA polymerase-3 subunit alpha